ncbi:MAG: prepilin-type N-terminal cleavage/methylation domain-containing protein [Myxococcota bacterium]|nr:prepilin-type N-terminal cleavage/methylation domain-containing protein [Myxococcota bacterium]
MKRGFTLIELMIAVVIIGILASVAIPTFLKFVKRTKTSEAAINLKAIFTGASAYFQMDFEGTTHLLPASATYTPAAAPTAGGYVLGSVIEEFADTSQPNGPTWTALNWRPNRDFYFAYSFSHNCGTEACVEGEGQYTAAARADLDGDNTYSSYTQQANVIAGQLTVNNIAVENAIE